MKSIPLLGTGIETSALGFGCSALLGDRTREDALRMLDTAYDSGIRYFDVAPGYGQGLAEDIVGQFVEKKRDQVVVATKFGIEPSLPTVARSPFVRRIARAVMRTSPKLRQLVGKASSATMTTGRFRPDAAQRSIERSLRLLRTSHIDVLLLHDGTPDDVANADELLEFLQKMVYKGTIRCFGVGTSIDSATVIAASFPAFAHILQFANSVLIPGMQTVQPRGAAVTFAPLSGSYSALRKYLMEGPQIGRAWSSEIGAECTNPATLSALMLAYAVRANRRGPVLFSSRDPERIRENAHVLINARNFTDEQIDCFAGLARASGVTAL